MQHPSPAPSTPRLVVIDPHHVVRQDLATFFGDDGYDVVVHPRAAGALALIRRVQPTVVLIELHLEYPQAGLDVVRALRADPATTELPLVVWSTDLDVSLHVAALNVPAVTVVSKYVAAATVRAAIATAVAAVAGPAARWVLVIEDDRDTRAFYEYLLTADGYQVLGAGTGQEALAHLASQPVQAIVLDRRLPDVDGVQLCRLVRHRLDAHVPIIVVTADHEPALAAAARAAGSSALLLKPFAPTALLDLLPPSAA